MGAMSLSIQLGFIVDCTIAVVGVVAIETVVVRGAGVVGRQLHGIG